MTHVPYTEVNEPWPTYERGWWVRLVEVKMPFAPANKGHASFSSGARVTFPHHRLGLVNERKNQCYCIQFGAGGPFEWHHKDALTLATKSQVAYMEGTSI